MANTISKIPFRGTNGQQEQFYKAIEKYRGKSEALIPVLQEGQKIYGYLPYEVQKMIAEFLDISMKKVYEVVTFYAQFSLQPLGEYNISVCLGTVCYVKGSGEIFKKLQEKLGIKNGECTSDGKFRLDACRCVGACGLAPVITVNDDVYGRLTVDQLDGILTKYGFGK